MKHQILNLLYNIFPSKIIFIKLLRLFFPNNYVLPLNTNIFFSVKDIIANNSFQVLLRADGYIEKVIWNKGLYGSWEKESLKIWAELSKKAQTIIIDIGANTGIYALLAQNQNSNSTIIAIEPVDINFNVLSQNIKKNNFAIKAEKVALSDREGTAKMFMLKDRLNYMTSVNDDRYALHPEIKGNIDVVEIEVSIKPFSYVFEKYKLNTIDLIKIDVEGHETTVLEAMKPYLEKYKPTILVEIIGNDNAVILDEMFSKIGYKYVSIDENNKSTVVDKLWDNDHHNFLICTDKTVDLLRSKQLVK